MKTPKQLTREELESIVSDLQGFLFLDDDDGGICWNGDKEVSGAEFVEFSLASLRAFGATPDGIERVVDVR